MISKSHMKALSKSKSTDVWCLDALGEHSMRFDRLSLCSQIKAIPIEDVVAMLTEIHDDSKNIRSTMLNCDCFHEGIMAYDKLIQQKINELKGGIKWI